MPTQLPRFDLHCHSKFSDGRNTIEQNVRMAEAAGLSALALTDHYFSAKDARWLDDYLTEIARLRATTTMNLLAGVEATVLDASGEVSIDPDTAGKLDLVLVDLGQLTEGIARDTPADKRAHTRRVIDCLKAVCAHEHVDMLAHPMNLGRFETPLTIADFTDEQLADLAQTCADTDTAFDVMNQMSYWFPRLSVRRVTEDYVRLVRLMARGGVRFSVGSDAHSAGAIGNLVWSCRVLELADVSDDQIIDPAHYLATA